MPTYEYLCDACGHGFEQFQSMKDKPVRKCPKCSKNSLRRIIHGGAGVIFKGSGFYQTDYRSKNYHEAAKKETDAKSKTSKETPPCGPSSCKQPDVCRPEKNKK